MKSHPATFQRALTTMTVAAICLGASWISTAQSTSTTNTVPPTANPSDVVPGSAAGAPGTITISPSSAGVPTAQTPTLPYGATEVLKMYKGGINKDIILNYINNTALAYHLSADGILYLQSVGIPQEITKAMLVRDGQLQQQQVAMQPPPYYGQQPAPPSGAYPPPGMAPNGAYGTDQVPPPQVAVPTSPAPDVTVIGSDYPAYPYYYDAWPYYGPVVVGGWGWGWGGGFRGGYGGFRGGGGDFHGGGGGGFHGGGGGGGFRGGGGSHGGGGGGHH